MIGTRTHGAPPSPDAFAPHESAAGAGWRYPPAAQGGGRVRPARCQAV